MEVVLQFLQTYGLWIALGGGMLFLMSRGGGMGCCGGMQQGSSCSMGSQSQTEDQTPTANQASGRTGQPVTAAELQARLAELRAEQERLSRQIADLDEAPLAASGRNAIGGFRRSADDTSSREPT